MSGQTSVLEIEEFSVDANADAHAVGHSARILRDRYFELGQWLSGLESFCSAGPAIFGSGNERTKIEKRNSAEFNICRSVLIRCSELTRSLRADRVGQCDPKIDQLAEIERFIPGALVLNNTISRSEDSAADKWNAWREILADKLKALTIVSEFDAKISQAGEEYISSVFNQLADRDHLSREDRRDLRWVLPKLGGVLLSLWIVKQMLEADKPISPALAVFAHIYETVSNLISDINNRLAGHPDESSELFAMLDAASYTLSIETKKVFAHELTPVLSTRSATLAFARVESAYGIMHDNLCQLITGFAQLADPDGAAMEYFPDFQEKLKESTELRQSLWSLLQTIRILDASQTDESMLQLRDQLDEFRSGPIKVLFYKDRETFERFCTEISLTGELKDAAPVVHRFAAYVETLFSLVKMRAVLANHPMERER